MGPEGPGAGEDSGGLRAALAGLTTRGRSFLAAGVAAAVCSYVLGQADLLRVGLLLAALPLVCVAVVYRTRYRVAGSRRLAPARVPAGSEARVHLRMDNVSRLPTGLLMLQDRVPYVLGPRPRFVLDRVEPGGRREVSYRVRSDLRGRYPLGPLQLRLSDPFGMCELTRAFSAYDTLTVIPRVEPLPPVRLTGEAAGYGDGRHRSLALAGEDDVIPRGYRIGDDLRRVHWRSTARYGELMVRREEQPQRAHCTVLLDTRRTAHYGSGPDSAFEWAVSGAASAAVHLLERGYAVRLLTDSGNSVPGPDGGGGFTGSTHDSAETAGLMLDTLAVVDHSDGGGSRPPSRCCGAAVRGCWWPSWAIWTRSRRRRPPGCGTAPRPRWRSCWTPRPGRAGRSSGAHGSWRSGCGGCARRGGRRCRSARGPRWHSCGGRPTPRAPPGRTPEAPRSAA